MNRRFVPWVLSIAIVSCLCLIIAVTVQQSYRQSANDPQIQLAEDMSAAFSNNQFTDETIKSSFESFVPGKMQVDIGSSLLPWIQVYDESGEVLYSSVSISDVQSTPRVPRGILEWVTKHGEDRVTWQPQKDLRQAIVVTKFNGLRNGYIVAGRSLKEIEKREGELDKVIAIGWMVMMILIGSAAAWNFGYFTQFTKQKNPRA
ncbi:MAG: hypothetical protein NTX72_05340 [Candidatus Uhrbacteria bacterium]|nr:hypothetical protein [Candidatus Uhrbacteria bacterium]